MSETLLKVESGQHPIPVRKGPGYTARAQVSSVVVVEPREPSGGVNNPSPNSESHQPETPDEAR